MLPGLVDHQWQPARGTGILNNELYRGRLVWNRLRYMKDPDTGKRRSRPNSDEALVVHDVPELRIIDDALWQGVKDRQAQMAQDTRPDADRRKSRFTSRPGPNSCSRGSCNAAAAAPAT